MKPGRSPHLLYPYEEMYLAGLTYQEIGRLLDRNPDAVYSYLYTKGYRPRTGRAKPAARHAWRTFPRRQEPRP